MQAIMDNALFIAILAGLGGMVGWGAADFFAKKTIDNIGDLRTLFWAQLIGIAPLLIAILLNPDVPKINTYDPLFLILFGIVGALSYLPLYSAFGKGKVSIISPIFASYSVVVVVLAAIFLNAHISGLQWLAIFIVFAGVLLLSIDPSEIRQALGKKGQLTGGVPQALTALVGYSFWLMFLDKFLNGREWLFFLLIIRSVAVLTLLIYSAVIGTSLSVKDRGLWKYLALIGLFDVAAFSAVSYGFSHTDFIGVVTVLSATFSIPTIILAYLFLKERVSRLQVGGIAVILAGVVIISLS
jgi:drug/metabolite transporter (DMT)-like permease